MGPLHLNIQVLQLPGMLYVLPAGLLTCCRSTGPVPPSSPWPAVARPPARPTCTVASTPCSTPNPPTTSGRKTSTCAWTLPWKLVSVEGFSWTCERTPIEELNLFFLYLQASTANSSSLGMSPSLSPAGAPAPVTPTLWESCWCLERDPRTLVTSHFPTSCTPPC